MTPLEISDLTHGLRVIKQDVIDPAIATIESGGELSGFDLRLIESLLKAVRLMHPWAAVIEAEHIVGDAIIARKEREAKP